MRNNVIGTLNLADACFLKGIHITVFATGCIYAYDDKHPIGGPGYVETDKANFDASFYSEKLMLRRLVQEEATTVMTAV